MSFAGRRRRGAGKVVVAPTAAPQAALSVARTAARGKSKGRGRGKGKGGGGGVRMRRVQGLGRTQARVVRVMMDEEEEEGGDDDAVPRRKAQYPQHSQHSGAATTTTASGSVSVADFVAARLAVGEWQAEWASYLREATMNGLRESFLALPSGMAGESGAIPRAPLGTDAAGEEEEDDVVSSTPQERIGLPLATSTTARLGFYLRQLEGRPKRLAPRNGTARPVKEEPTTGT